jgi:hypothetical protein
MGGNGGLHVIEKPTTAVISRLISSLAFWNMQLVMYPGGKFAPATIKCCAPFLFFKMAK